MTKSQDSDQCHHHLLEIKVNFSISCPPFSRVDVSCGTHGAQEPDRGGEPDQGGEPDRGSCSRAAHRPVSAHWGARHARLTAPTALKLSDASILHKGVSLPPPNCEVGTLRALISNSKRDMKKRHHVISSKGGWPALDLFPPGRLWARKTREAVWEKLLALNTLCWVFWCCL